MPGLAASVALLEALERWSGRPVHPDDLRQILRDLDEAGFIVAPTEPTPEMTTALNNYIRRHGVALWPSEMWAAMIEAKPKLL